MPPPWTNRDQLRDAVFAQARLEFRAIFGREPDERWLQRVREIYERQCRIDREARDRLQNVVRAPGSVRAFLAKYGLDKSDLGHDKFHPLPPFVVVLGRVAKGMSNDELKNLSIRDHYDWIARSLPLMHGLHAFVIEHFLQLPTPTPFFLGSPAEALIPWDRLWRESGVRALSYSELACVALVLQAGDHLVDDKLTITPDEVHAATVEEIIHREREKLRQAYDHHHGDGNSEEDLRPDASDPGIPSLPFAGVRGVGGLSLTDSEETAATWFMARRSDGQRGTQSGPSAPAVARTRSGQSGLATDWCTGDVEQPRINTQTRCASTSARYRRAGFERRHRGRPTVPLPMTPQERAVLESRLVEPSTSRWVRQREQGLLLLADGATAREVAERVGVDERTVFKWRDRFRADNPLSRLDDAPRSGRPRSRQSPDPMSPALSPSAPPLNR